MLDSRDGDMLDSTDGDLPDYRDDMELEEEIPEDKTSTVSLSEETPLPDVVSVSVSPKPDTRQSVSVETETEPREDTDAGTQCEAFMLTTPVTYAENGTQTDYDPDFAEHTAVLHEVKPRASQGTQMRTPSPSPPPPAPVCIDTACGPSTIDLIDPVRVYPTPLEVTPPQSPAKPPTRTKRQKSKGGADRRKLKSRGMNLHTAARAVSGKRSSSSSVRPAPGSGKSHPVLKNASRQTNKPINFPTRSLRGKPPREKWQIAAERVYVQQRQGRAKPVKSDKMVLGLKTAISEVKSFTLPPPAVYEVRTVIITGQGGQGSGTYLTPFNESLQLVVSFIFALFSPQRVLIYLFTYYYWSMTGQ